MEFEAWFTDGLGWFGRDVRECDVMGSVVLCGNGSCMFHYVRARQRLLEKEGNVLAFCRGRHSEKKTLVPEDTRVPGARDSLGSVRGVIKRTVLQ